MVLTARLLLVGAVILAVVGCGDGADDDAGTAPSEPVTYVALGGIESALAQEGKILVDAWTQQVYRELPLRTVHVAVAQPGAVASQLDSQVDDALDLDATLATIWLGRTDEARANSLDRFTSDVEAAIRRLRRAGVRVLMITDATTDAYGDAAARAATQAGAPSVDVGELDPLNPDQQAAIARRVGRELSAIR